jgi:hypothetical protein
VTEAERRVEAVVAMWRGALREAGKVISGDLRCSEADAAWLLGLAPGSLKNRRHEGDTPRAYRIGVGGSRVSYRLHDLALWLERQRER